jgi:hypothetical protein
LSKRLSKHKNDYKVWKDGNGKKGKVTSFVLFDEFGIENCKIELIENFACLCKDELLKKEGEHIKNNDCVNKVIAGRTKKEYYIENKDNKKKFYIDNKDKILEYQKEYYIENKDNIKKFYIDNKDKILEYQKKYYQNKKDIIKQKSKEYYAKKKLAIVNI